MSEDCSFVRFYVLLAGEWASQCQMCWRIIGYSRNPDELAFAEGAHDCAAKQPSARAGAAPHAATEVAKEK